MSSTSVAAIIPLSLLQAIRNLDTPVEDGLQEIAEEIVARRLGLSQTVAAQIARYEDAVARGREVPVEEAVAVFRLVDRRPDAELAFADAGRRAARHVARTAAFPVRALVSGAPAFVGRRVGSRAAASAAREVFGAELSLVDNVARARLAEPLSLRVGAQNRGCGFYGAALGELLRCHTGFEGAMLHERCRLRGEDECAWRAVHTGDYE